jgi:hypothetical protein
MSVKVGAVKAGRAADEFFTTDTDWATGVDATNAVGSSTNVVVPPAPRGVGDLQEPRERCAPPRTGIAREEPLRTPSWFAS